MQYVARNIYRSDKKKKKKSSIKNIPKIMTLDVLFLEDDKTIAGDHTLKSDKTLDDDKTLEGNIPPMPPLLGDEEEFVGIQPKAP